MICLTFLWELRNMDADLSAKLFLIKGVKFLSVNELHVLSLWVFSMFLLLTACFQSCWLSCCSFSITHLLPTTHLLSWLLVFLSSFVLSSLSVLGLFFFFSSLVSALSGISLDFVRFSPLQWFFFPLFCFVRLKYLQSKIPNLLLVFRSSWQTQWHTHYS